jgi:hypothetical protein
VFELSQRDKTLLYILPFIIFGYISYQFVLPYTKQRVSRFELMDTNINNSIDKSKKLIKSFDKSDYHKKLAQLDTKIQQQKLSITKVDKAILYLKKINSNYTKEVNWASIVQQISQSAYKHSIKINNIINKDTPHDGISLSIDGASKYKNLLFFIDALESYNIKFAISNLELKNNNNVKFKMDVEVVKI